MLSLEAATSPRRSSRNLNNPHKTRPLSCSSPTLTPSIQHLDLKGKSREHAESTVELSVGSRKRLGKRGRRWNERDKDSNESMQLKQGSTREEKKQSEFNQHSNSTLPHLLSHLSLSNPFPPPHASTSTFVFPTLESSFLTLQLPPLPTSKRPPSLPPSSRCKKRKLLHTFIRSPLLLSPPPSTSSTRRQVESIPPRWWASISNCSGESKPSRFSPPEEEWIEPPTQPQESNWISRSFLTTRQQTLLDSPSRPLIPRSISAPAVLLDHPQKHSEEEEEIPISGPALKKLLLMSLRNKWTSEGGPTTAGEAALRFKKWVLWNHWRISSLPLTLPLASTDPLPSSNSSTLTSDYSALNFPNVPSNSSSSSSSTSSDDLFNDDDDDDNGALVPSSYFTTVTTDSEGEEFEYEGENGGGDCWFTQTGQMVFASSTTSNSSTSSNSSLMSLPSPSKEKEKDKEMGRKGRPGLRRSETVPTSLPSRSVICEA